MKYIWIDNHDLLLLRVVSYNKIIAPTFCGDSKGLKKIHERFAGHSIRGWACKGAAQGKDGKETHCQNFHLKWRSFGLID